MVGHETEHVDLDHLSGLRELMEDEFGLLIETFLDDGAQRIAELHGFVEDADALRRAAHALKGGASNIGATILARLCADLEMLAQQDDGSRRRPMVAAIECEFDAVRTALTRL